MKWSDVGHAIEGSLPALGGILGGPAGAAAGVLVSKALGVDQTPEAVTAALNPDALVKLQEVQADLQKAQINADSANLVSVNNTMQAEAKSDHWPTYSWRPAIGFAVALNTLGASIIVLAVFVAQIAGVNVAPAMAQLPVVLGSLAAVSATAMPVLGIASYYRGKMQADPRIPTDNRG